MCLSIILGLETKNGDSMENPVVATVAALAQTYSYGLGVGEEKIIESARRNVVKLLSGMNLLFEIHDLPEEHCACDIDQDIRNCSKFTRPSKFFDFISEVQRISGVSQMEILFFQEELPTVYAEETEKGRDNVRRASGSYDEFVKTLNKWNTWQVAGFEPNRQAYLIEDESPFLYTFIMD